VTGLPAWLNGKLVADATLSASDRGFLLGDGVFETMRTAGPTILWLDDHLARLRAGADLLGIPLDRNPTEIADGLAELVAVAGLEHGALRLTLSRGPSAGRGLVPPLDPVPTLLASIAKLVPAVASVSLVVAKSVRRNEGSPLSRAKSLNYGDNLVARREAILRGADDAILLNNRGLVTCATVASLFFKLDGRWVTPPVGDGVLPGLARQRLIGLLGAGEESVQGAALAHVDSIMLSNSLGLSAAVSLDGRVFVAENFAQLSARLFGGP
jgi:branched-chain amino acid aminotransferase